MVFSGRQKGAGAASQAGKAMMRICRTIVLLVMMLLLVAAGASCERDRAGGDVVVLYTSLNEPTARAVIDAFEAQTGIRVIVQADTERDKTVGLVRTLIEEQSRPRTDVFWNSEAAQMVRLKQAGVLAPIDPPPAAIERIDPRFRDPQHYWIGFAARARILIVNTELVPEVRRPTSIFDITDPQWRGQTAIVRPVTGTTLTHMTALYEVLGEERTNQFIDAILANECHLPPGNGRLAQLVGEGQIAFGLTDSSDFRMVRNQGRPVVAVYPDQDELGTLVIPNTVGLIRGGPNPENALRLIEFLLSEESEAILAHHPRGHIPLQPGVSRPQEVKVPGEFRTMDVDLSAVGLGIEQRMGELDRRFP
jgi:iron(III) transport system substrate-binding protein